DQTAPADAPATSAPAPAAPTAPEPKPPAATPANVQGDVQQQQQQDQAKPSGRAADAATLAKHAGHKPARRHHTKKPTRASHPAAASLTTLRPTHPAVGARPQPSSQHAAHHAPTHPAVHTPTAPPSDAQPLDTRSNLAVDGTQPLQPLDNVAPAETTVPPAPPMADVPALTPTRTSTDTHPPTAHTGTPQPHTDHHPHQPRPTHAHITETPAPRHAATSPGQPGGHATTPSTPSVPGVPSGPGSQGNFFNSLPGPGNVQGVPNFVIQRFHVPPFLLSIYQAAGIQYGIRWEVLAAINEIETDYGRNLNVSSAGALGWMQFMPSTWQMYGVDANKDGKRDPYNPVDAIFAAARYLKAAGGDKDIRTAIFAYNHAGWYVDSVMLRARLIAGYPQDLIGSLTGLTEGRFPVAARARYAGDQSTKPRQVGAGQNAANVVDSNPSARGIDIYAAKGAPVVAVNDGVIKAMGQSKTKGRYIVLQDVYGNQYTYSNLGSLARLHPVPKPEQVKQGGLKAVGAHDPKPAAPASAGTQRPGTAPAPKTKPGGRRSVKAPSNRVATSVAAVKQRLFAHPQRPVAKRHGGIQQMAAHGDATAPKGFETYDNYFSRALGLNSKNATLKPLRKGSHVIASTVLGRVGAGDPTGGKESHIHFEIRPAGRGAPRIDPKPILDGWKLLESTAVYRAKGRNVLYGNGDFSIGEIMLLPKPLLEKRVLSDPRIAIYPAGRSDISTGQIDRRVLIVLEYLAESGLKPTVSCLRSGHSLLTTSGNVSEHSSGNAVDISAINGVPIIGHQGAGGVTVQAVKRLMLLQGTLRPHQIISLLDFGQNTMALPDHANHIHVGFQPLFGSNAKLGRETQSILRPGQWDTLVQRLGEIQNPTVPTQPSKYAIPATGRNGE
ncbi:MAG: hypothetical protein QOJ68_193, partial [Blastococcus sp.]|nr:hypothetical protein [Blastococcus sp.]